MAKIKILLVHNKYLLPGGEDIGFESEKKMLLSYGHKVIVYTRSNHEILNYSIIKKILFPVNLIWADKTYKDITKIIEKNKPDVAHFHNTFPLVSPSAYYACRDKGVPVVQLLNNYRLICPGGFLFRDDNICEDCITKGLQESIKHRCYKNSVIHTSSLAAMLKFHRLKKTWSELVNKYIVLSEFSKNKYIKAGFPAKKFVVKSNFIEKDPFPRRSHDGYVLFFGRLSREKGPHIFLQSAKNLSNTNIKFKIVGSGPMQSELHKYAKDNNLKNVQFIKHIKNEKIFSLIKKAKFVVIPMMWFEFLPRVLIETLACGVPIITCNVGVMADIVKPRVHGLHFNIGDANDLSKKVLELNSDDELIKSMSLNARILFKEKYTQQINYKQLIDIYDEVLNAK